MTESIYKRAVDKFGRDAQLGVLQEECAELIQAVSKLKREPSPESLSNLAEEIADVEIMIEQVKAAIIPDWQIEAFKKDKLKRLEKLL